MNGPQHLCIRLIHLRIRWIFFVTKRCCHFHVPSCLSLNISAFFPLQVWLRCVWELPSLLRVEPSTRASLSVSSHSGTVWWKHRKTRAHRTSTQSAGVCVMSLPFITYTVIPFVSTGVVVDENKLPEKMFFSGKIQ